ELIQSVASSLLIDGRLAFRAVPRGTLGSHNEATELVAWSLACLGYRRGLDASGNSGARHHSHDHGLYLHLCGLSLMAPCKSNDPLGPIRYCNPLAFRSSFPLLLNQEIIDLLSALQRDNLRLGGAVPSLSELLSQSVLVF